MAKCRPGAGFEDAATRVDYGPLLALFDRWVPDAADRRAIQWDTPRRLFGSNGPITPHSKSLSSYPCMIQLPQLGSLNHIPIPVGIPFMSL